MSEFNQIKYINDWQKKNVDRITLIVPKGERAKIQELAITRGYKSTNAYLMALIKADAKRKTE